MKRVCKVCGKETGLLTNQMVRNNLKEEVCKDCLKKANISTMKFGMCKISAYEVECKIKGETVNANENRYNKHIMLCKMCNKEISTNADKCPYCGEPTVVGKTSKRAKGCLMAPIAILSTIIIIAIIVGVVGVLNLTSSTSPTNTGLKDYPDNVIYSNDNIQITYMGLDDPNAGLTMYQMKLKVENNYNKNVLINITDSYVNNTQVQFLGGSLSLDGIEPGKNAVNVYTFGYDNLGVSDIDEIERLEFKINIVDPDSFSTVLKTETIVLDFTE